MHSSGTWAIGGSTSTDIPTEAFRDWVMSIVYPTDTARIDCGPQCSSQPIPLPDFSNAAAGFAPYGADQRQCYYYRATYDFESGYDFTTINGQVRTGSGSVRGHACGITPLSLTTDLSIASPGLVSVTASNKTTVGTPACSNLPGTWRGCDASTGCSVCEDLVRDYPKYFANHRSCTLSTMCGSAETYQNCSWLCARPSMTDK